MFLHIVIDSYYSLETAKILKEIKNSSSHIFIMMRGSGSSNQHSILEELKEEVLAISPEHSQFYARFTDEWLRRFDKIFIHGMYHSSLIHALLNKTKPSTFERIYFLPYGGDIQLAMQSLQSSPQVNLSFLAMQKIKNWILPPGYRSRQSFFFESYPSEQCNFFEVYPIIPQPLQPDCIAEVKNTVQSKLLYKSSPLKILIGHSCSPSDNHILVLRKLAPLAKSDIQVCLPMAYHLDLEYRKEVYELARSIFGKKVSLWTEYLEPKQYAKKLKSIDIAVFNLKKDSGFGVMSYLLMCGTKLYASQRQLQSGDLRLLVDQGCTIFEYESLVDFPFSLLTPIDQEAALNNFKVISNSTYSRKMLKDNWKKLIEL
jgi:hypothetical protein